MSILEALFFAIAATAAPCGEEDASSSPSMSVCLWDAKSQGNGQGQSFLNFKFSGDNSMVLREDGTLRFFLELPAIDVTDAVTLPVTDDDGWVEGGAGGGAGSVEFDADAVVVVTEEPVGLEPAEDSADEGSAMSVVTESFPLETDLIDADRPYTVLVVEEALYVAD